MVQARYTMQYRLPPSEVIGASYLVHGHDTIIVLFIHAVKQNTIRMDSMIMIILHAYS